MGGQVSRDDFEWVYTQHPHVDRRKIIIEKYPEIKKLMGPDPNLKYIVIAMVMFQFISVLYISQLSWFWVIILAYCLGGVINHSLTLAVHEISHNFAFGNFYPFSNRLFGMFANLPLGVPMSVTFKRYHLEHHRFQGTDGIDTDIPTDFEGKLFHNTATKIVWLFLQPLFYSFRPMAVRPKAPSALEIINLLVQLVYDVIIFNCCGVKGVFYCIGGTLLSLGLHPMAAHFIAEHYMFKLGYETYSYYGPWNYITFNVGYHMEHHDFPYIPGSRLPEVKRVAAEFYDDLPQHLSWPQVIWDFLFDPDMGPYSRMKRSYNDVFVNKPVENPKLLGENTAELMQQLKQRKCHNGLHNGNFNVKSGSRQGEVNGDLETE
ncbi:sphingolipid delta(4)-desaturase DES1-like isoform X2 [Dysidea avara]|uniref:sphingolipid delta(4)-desaturase DES1-like isoform X2 n=1 Tax=Dysidea avara TaxID=196820 RepID=UPI003324D2B6